MKAEGSQVPRVLVVTLVRDDARGLEVTRRSVRGQVNSHMRHVIVPAPSRDGSEVTARGWARRGEVDVWEGAPPGIYPAMNWVLDRADPQDQVIFLNAGDFFLHPQALSDLSSASAEAASPWSTGPFLTFAPGGWIRAASLGGSTLDPTDVAHQATLVSVSALREFGGFDESFEIFADGKLLRRLRQRHAPGLTSYPVVAYGIDGFSHRHPRASRRELARLDREVPGFPRHGGVVTEARKEALALALRSGLPARALQPFMRRHGAARRRLVADVAGIPHWAHPRVLPDSLACCLQAPQEVRRATGSG
jgi:hypothetical protein